MYDVKKYTNEQRFIADKNKHFRVNFSEPKYGILLKVQRNGQYLRFSTDTSTFLIFIEV
jgi:hypothetical protein